MNIQDIAQIFKMAGEAKQRALLEVLHRDRDGETKLMELAAEPFSPAVRRWAVHGLGAYQSKGARDQIAKALCDKAMSVRHHAISAVRSQNVDGEYQLLIPLLKDESGGVRMYALQVLGERKIPEARTQIEAMRSDEKSYIRKEASRLIDHW